MEPPTKLTTAATGVLGAWLVTAPFALGAPLVDRWNDIVAGGTIAVLAGYNLSHDRIHGTPNRRVSWFQVALGAWLLFAPFATGVVGVLLWNDVGVGVLVSSFAGYNAYAASLADRSTPLITADET